MARVCERFMERRAVSSVGRASRLHRRNSHETRDNLSTDRRTERDSMANIPASADHIRTISDSDLSAEAFAGRAAFLLECAIAADFNEPAMPGRKRPTSYTYFIASEHGPIKIGSARHPYDRLCTLQVGNPEELFIYATADGGYDVEFDFHKEFAQFRLRGEWYRRAPEILRRIIHLQQQEIARLTTGGARG